MQSVQHDAAMAGAAAIVALVAHLLREEERLDLFRETYDVLMATLRKYEEKAERRARRLGKN